MLAARRFLRPCSSRFLPKDKGRCTALLSQKAEIGTTARVAHMGCPRPTRRRDKCTGVLIELRQRRSVRSSLGTGGQERALRSSSGSSNSRRRWRPKPPDPRRSLDHGNGDEYRWMQDISSEEVIAHLQNENRYAAAVLEPLRPRVQELHECMVERQPKEEGNECRSVPERLGQHLYYTRRDEDKGFPVYVRRPVDGTISDEHVVLDLNEIESSGLGGHAGGGEGATNEDQERDRTPAVGAMKLSSDERMLACTIDLDGSGRFVLAVFSLESPGPSCPVGPTGPILRGDAMWDDVVGVEWGSTWKGSDANRSCVYEMFYTVPDELRRPWQVRRVILRREPCDGRVGDGGRASRLGFGGSAAAAVRDWEVDSASDAVVLEETHDAFFADVGKTKDQRFVVINIHSKTASEVHLLPVKHASGSDRERDRTRAECVDPPDAETPTLLRRKQDGVEYYVDHCGDSFFIVTNAPSSSARVETGSGGEYRLVRVRQAGGAASLRNIARAAWEPVLYSGVDADGGANPSPGIPIHVDETNTHTAVEGAALSPPSPGVHVASNSHESSHDGAALSGAGGTINEMDLFEDCCLLYESCRLTGAPRLRVLALTDSSSLLSPSTVVYPPAPGGCRVADEREGGTVAAASTLSPGVNSWFKARRARFSLSSPIAPEDVYDICLETGRLELLRRTDVPGDPRFEGGDYRCYRVQVTSYDGERVPLTIAHHRDLELNGGNRLLLHGYGAYGMSLPMEFYPGHICMLERGWVLAFAHVRGGGERGKRWHAAGRRLYKWNSFRDFEACAEHLIAAGYTTPASLGACVNSAGGLLAGVMTNTRPDLFAAMVLKAPFLGVMSAMRDTSLPLTLHEFDEWGDPNTCTEAEAMIGSYCPYENVRRQAYPALYVTASLNDTRVNYWDPAKWVSRVRAMSTGEAPIVLRISHDDGHHGPGNISDGLRESATEMAFLERHLEPGNA